jgi:hypothetical protein
VGLTGNPSSSATSLEAFDVQGIPDAATFANIYTILFYPWITSYFLHQGLNRFQGHTGRILIG